MIENREYFFITLDNLKDEKMFPFTLFVFNLITLKYTMYLEPNNPLTTNKHELLKSIEEHKGKIAIKLSQKRTFLIYLDHRECNIVDLKPKTIHPLQQKRLERIKDLEQKLPGENFSFANELSKSFENDNFLKIIERARAEIITFSVSTSHTISLAAYLAENLLDQDNETNRVIALSYFLAKVNGMDDEDLLADLVTAAFLHHLGLTQIDYEIIDSNALELNDSSIKDYKKHPGLSDHLIKKIKLDVSDRCKKIINQHHERSDGLGYPSQSIEQFIEPAALILGLSSHIVEFSKGRVTGRTVPIRTVMSNIKNKEFTTGLEFRFGDKIGISLINLYKYPSFKEKAA